MKSIATLLGCVVGLTALPSSGYAERCMVTVVFVDNFGNADWSTAHQVMCREGERNGGFEFYNPRNGVYIYKPPPGFETYDPQRPPGGSAPGTYVGSDSSIQTIPACTPWTAQHPKTKQRPQLPPDQHWCSSKPGGLGP